MSAGVRLQVAARWPFLAPLFLPSSHSGGCGGWRAAVPSLSPQGSALTEGETLPQAPLTPWPPPPLAVGPACARAFPGCGLGCGQGWGLPEGGAHRGGLGEGGAGGGHPAWEPRACLLGTPHPPGALGLRPLPQFPWPRGWTPCPGGTMGAVFPRLNIEPQQPRRRPEFPGICRGRAFLPWPAARPPACGVSVRLVWCGGCPGPCLALGPAGVGWAGRRGGGRAVCFRIRLAPARLSPSTAQGCAGATLPASAAPGSVPLQ